MEKGKIVQILGPVIDVEFETEQLPLIHDALTVVNKGKEVVMEVERRRLSANTGKRRRCSTGT